MRKLIIHKLEGLENKDGIPCYGASIEGIEGERINNGSREWLIEKYSGPYERYEIKVIDDVMQELIK